MSASSEMWNKVSRALWLWPCCITLALGKLPASAADADRRTPIMIYFYSPESSDSNYVQLKNEFDGYLAQFGNIKLQPFKNREDFDTHLANEREGLYVMSSWHIRQFPRRERLAPVLVGELDNRRTQTHALWVRGHTRTMAFLSGATIATARSLEYTSALMKEVTGDPTGEWVSGLNLKFLEVPKDIDALLAVIFGSAGAAIATDSAANKLAQTNPKQWETLNVLSRSRPSLLPVVVAPKQAIEPLEDVIRILSEMGKNEEGRKRLGMIGLDGWEILEPDQWEELVR